MHPTSAFEVAIGVTLPVGGHLIMSSLSLRKGGVEWFLRLRKPPWTPAIFTIQVAWNTLLALLGFASWLVFREGGVVVQAMPLSLYLLVLVLSLTWCPLFARLHLLDWALANACMLLAAVLAMFLEFAKVLGLVTTLLLIGPFVLWTAIGTVFCYTVVYLDSFNDMDSRGTLS